MARPDETWPDGEARPLHADDGEMTVRPVPPELRKLWGECLAALMVERRFSVQLVAAYLQVSVGTVELWISGRIGPSPLMRARIVEMFQ